MFLRPHTKLFETTALVRSRLNRELRVTGVMLCLYETGTRLAADVTDDLKTFLDGSAPDAPWANAQIFATKIRRNIKLAEAPSFGQSIFEYAPSCPGSQDYGALAEEVIAAESAGVPMPLANAA